MEKHKPDPEYTVGYKKPPPETRFRKGVSGNPNGRRPKTATLSIGDAIREALYEPLRNNKGRLTSMNRRRLSVRRLIERAIEGDERSLTDLIRMREEAGGARAPIINKVSFADGLKSTGFDKLTDEYFEKQDRETAEIRQQIKAGRIPMGDLIDRELGRLVPGTLNGKPVKIPAVRYIALVFTNKASEGNGRIARLLQKLAPEKKKFERKIVTEIARPTAEELAGLKRQQAREEQNLKDVMNDVGPTVGELLKAGKWRPYDPFIGGH